MNNFIVNTTTILFPLVLIFFSCTGPDFERDHILDPKADTPVAEFFNMSSTITRGTAEYESFEVLVNSAVINQKATISLSSDRDGIFFSEPEVTTEVLKIDRTILSPGEHQVTLLVNDNILDVLTVRVTLSSNVRIYDVVYERGALKISWSKYTGSDFSNYYLFQSKKGEASRFATLIADIEEINDTVFYDYDYLIEDEFDYFIRTKSSLLNLNQNSTALFGVEPDFIRNNLDYSYANLILKNDIPFLVFLEDKNGKNILAEINIYSNEYSIIYDQTSFSSIYLDQNSSPQKLFAISSEDGHLIYEFDVNNFTNTNTYDIVNLPEVDFDSTRDTLFTNQGSETSGFVSDITFESELNLYFVSMGRNIFTLDQNFNFISQYTAERSITRFFPAYSSARRLFGLRKFSETSYDLIYHQYDENGGITNSSDINNERSIYTEREIGVVSVNNNLVVTGSRGNKFSANSNLADLDDLVSTIHSFTDYYIDANQPQFIYASNNSGFFVKANIATGDWVEVLDSDYSIERFFVIDDGFYLLESNENKFKVSGKPVFMSN